MLNIHPRVKIALVKGHVHGAELLRTSGGTGFMPISKIRGVNINWQVVGDSAPWVVMTTGGRRSYGEFVPLANKIAAYGYRILLHDRRNTGASDVLIEGDEGEEIPWTRDMFELTSQQNIQPAFFCGSSSGARTSILFYLRYPQAVRGLLLMRVTGGPFAAGRLPENYYGQFIRAAQQGGMAAVCATEQWQERIAANPATRDTLMAMSPRKFIDVMTRWNEVFVAGGKYPVMGVSEDELKSIKAPTIIIPGNDKTHSSASARVAHSAIAGSELHRLPIEDQDVPLIPFPDWAPYEAEIARTFADFMARTIAAEKQPQINSAG
jgi:pimeloyl-ACP methyl ester carboxylesterase